MSSATSLRHRSAPWVNHLPDLLGFLGLSALLAWLVTVSAARLGYTWHWGRVPRYLYTIGPDGEWLPGPLLQGLVLTLELAAVALILTAAIGLVTALLRLSNSWLARMLAQGYLELIRNTPLLIQILFMYFVLAPLVGLDRFWAGVLALALFEGAYASEMIRAGILSIHGGQWEAAYSLGLSTPQTYGRVILPQAVRRILPPLTGQAVSLIKDSSLVSVISVFELTMQAKLVVADTFMTFEIWFTVAAIYLVLNLVLSFSAQGLERKLRIA